MLVCFRLRNIKLNLIASGVCLFFPFLGFCSILLGNVGSTYSGLSELETKYHFINENLGVFATPSLNNGIGAVGYRSPSYNAAEISEWLQINFTEPCIFDSIFLIPVLWRDAEAGFVQDAFPGKFRILAGRNGDSHGQAVFSYDFEQQPFVGIAPMKIEFEGVFAEWVRIEVDHLSARALDGRYLFQLSELMVFEGGVNRALRKPVTASSKLNESHAWNAAALVDGILPYIMNAKQGNSSRAYISSVGIGEQPEITIDLEAIEQISGIRLHAVDQTDVVPATTPGDFGLPKHFTIEVANRADFADAVTVLDERLENVFQTGPILSWDFPPVTGRYVRLRALKPYFYEGSIQGTRIGLAEFEIIGSHNQNLAQHKPIFTNYEHGNVSRPLSAMVDGANLYGNILSIRDWLEELWQRHQLELELAALELKISRRYEVQKQIVRWLIVFAVLMILLVLFLVSYYRMRNLKNEVHIRERIAANLHDELGANLHAIGMLGDVAERSLNTPERLVESVRRIRKLTERTGSAARYCTNMLEAKTLCEDVLVEMKHDIERLLSDHEVRFVVSGETHLKHLKRRQRVDFYLFFKESMTNINRHAKATKVYIRLSANEQMISLSVVDNGCGQVQVLPKALSRRARFMRASLQMKDVKPSGTHIRLKLKHKKFKWLQ